MGIELIYGYFLGILTFVVMWVLKKMTIRKGIKEIKKEKKEKKKVIEDAIERVEKAKNEPHGTKIELYKED